MSFILTEEQEELLALVRKFSEKEILPYAHQMDVEAHFVPGLIQKIADLGFMGINVPEEYGGVGADEVTKALVIMEFASITGIRIISVLCSNVTDTLLAVRRPPYCHNCRRIFLIGSPLPDPPF